MNPCEVIVRFETPEEAADFCKAIETDQIAWGPDIYLEDWANRSRLAWVFGTDHEGKEH